MDLSIEQILRQFTSKINSINKIYFANNALLAPVLAYQVNFPRIEIIINGQQEILWANDRGEQISNTLYANDILYVTSNSWNKPLWHKPVTILSILFGKQQIGLSLLHWDGTQIIPKGQLNIARRGPRIGAFIIQAIAELTWHNQPSEQNQTAYFLIHSLLSSTLDLLNADIETASKTTSLFEAIRQYIDTHFREDVTRDFLAKMFYISPNYLSHLFQREGKIGLNEYLNQIRLEYAKSLLKNYDLNVKEIAHASGFKDSNYFCRIFRKKTERSPSEYRRQYHSKLSQK
ncbi:helix-turn-helix transcriptional regulator [Gilliamella sp. B14448G11]|uniref:helix-turn-helix transcriptional regulator n=1 Tax=unclassified Gilliamella TaxID=2685620 RepID=UPI0018DC0A41|nr:MULTISPECIES: AraC family transcriptional regulator [unclassified Gilliamella]MBI0029019.1 helix-turn-helix transcriptional regulator [Gilliamella sp. B14448G7]MBI0032099.1 helix-turn-helix transcriptional regulator [Gilliamella sp. B14384G15]MBI0035856.1 helix-turn-helix transcriptional regulator [Gilliamella sp. B14448G11]MBI0043181.1 helix-turn-helix transcriptional regulator [Gilliamella sp. B14448G12]MBI0059393.1 helix-turn-helix transcriptional regulator [Gilliamella sp. B14384G12]